AASSVMPYCHKCKKGVRVATQILKDGEKVRVCATCEDKLGGKK
ncbi:MAG: 50S ribosomal protein L24, partial [Deltaproteobacteria bacterium]|nr:50S ribosomal protein L24 [Deltaproteobacteria bacterium]